MSAARMNDTLRNLVDRFAPSGSFFRNVWVLSAGTALAQLIMMLALPVLTRLYSPDDFNLLAAYASILGLLTVASCLRYNIAIPLPHDNATALNLLLLSLASGAGLAFLVAIPVLLAPAETSLLIGQPSLKAFLWLLPIGLFFAAAYDAMQYWAMRQSRFGLVAQTRVTRAVGGVGFQLGAGAAASGPGGLLIGHMLLSGLGFFGLARSFWQSDRAELKHATSLTLRATAYEYRKFPLYSVPESLANTAGLEIPILIIAAAAMGPEAGFLMLALRVVSMPMTLVGTSVAQVYLTEAAERYRAGNLAALTRRTMWAMFRTGAPLLLLASIVSPALFPLIFGDPWYRAGVMVVWIAPMCLLQFIASPVIGVLHVTGRLRLAMAIQFVGALMRIAAVLLALWFAPEYIVEMFAISGAVFYGLTLLVILRINGSATGASGHGTDGWHLR
jgi:O-antigen/teichoic acid export membrane protein